MPTQLKSYKFRIYPDLVQREKLNQTFGCCRFVWNKLVENFNSNIKPRVTVKEIKDTPEYYWLNDVSASALYKKQIDFRETLDQFFNKNRKVKLGKPKFKSKSDKQSCRLEKRRFNLDKNNNLIRLEKIGWVKTVISDDIPDNADHRSVTVSKTTTGKYYASILVKQDIEFKQLTEQKVGIDLGIKDLLILSNGTKIGNPKWFRENQSKLKKAQKDLSRKTKGSNRYEKQRLKLARIHERIKNQRLDFFHNLTIRLIYNYDLICIENLNVSGIRKNRKLSKSIQDASWSEFVRQLEYKTNWYGKTLVKVDRFYPSSKTCSNCNYKLNKLDLHKRRWKCPLCQVNHDRDLNASINILKQGYFELTSAKLVDNRRGEELRLFDDRHHLASSEKRLDFCMN